MGRNSNGVRGGANVSTRTQTADEYNNDLGVTVQSIKDALLSYASIDRWNRSSAYNMGFNDQATGLVEELAKGDYGLASTIAKQAVERNGWGQYGARFSEKQAYVLAKSAYDNKVVKGELIFTDSSKEAAEMDARQRAARSARRQRKKDREKSIKAAAESNKDYKVGSIVKEPRTGKKGRVVSTTDDIVEVDYGEGIKRKYARKYVRFL